MIPGDIGTEIARVLQDCVATGDLPAPAARLSAAGTWRPAPAEAGGGAGTYATSLPLTLAGLVGRPAEHVAELLASGLDAVPWVTSARVTGGGYLTVTVTAGHLAGLPARIVAAWPRAAASSALAGTRLTAPRLPDPGTAPSWEQAWRTQRDALAGRLAQAAGAEVLFFDLQQEQSPDSTTQAHAGPAPVTRAGTGSDPAARPGRGSVAAAVAFYGADAVRYALARTSLPQLGAISRQLGLPLDLANPFVRVQYAHADAASVLRWAAGLGLARDRQVGHEPAENRFAASRAATAQPGQPGPPAGLMPPECALVDAMSWLQERVAAAVRRHRPAELGGYLEHLADTWLDCADGCPALPFRGLPAPADPAGNQAAVRLRLADAARVVLAAGLGLLGVSAPARM